MKDSKGVDLNGRGCGEQLGLVEGGITIIGIYYIYYIIYIIFIYIKICF